MLKNTYIENDEDIISNKSELFEIFYSGFKDCSKRNIGLEFEKLPVSNKTFKASNYSDIKLFLNEYKSAKWVGIYENQSILGLKNPDGTVTLEPGCQTELSLVPKSKISEIDFYLKNYNKTTAKIAEMNDIVWLGYGIQPISTYNNMPIIPKSRYRYMTEYLPTVAKRPFIMMRETAGIQASFDYSGEEDAMRKFSIALKLSPLISASFSNSPVRNGRLTKLKSNRASSWLENDNARCGLVSSKAFSSSADFSFADYVEILLDVPMIFIERRSELLPEQKNAIGVKNLTFRQFLKNGYEGYRATKEDWLLHLSLYFPDVRFKNYIEIRNHDSQRQEYICAVPAFWKGIIYNKDAISEIENILNDFTYFDYEYLRRKTPQYGLDMTIKNKKLKELVKEIFDISYQSLKSYREGEEAYLRDFKSLIDKGLTPADIVIEKWQNEWSGDLSCLIEYSKLS